MPFWHEEWTIGTCQIWKGYEDIIYFYLDEESLELQTAQLHQKHGGVSNHHGKIADHNNIITRLNHPPLIMWLSYSRECYLLTPFWVLCNRNEFRLSKLVKYFFFFIVTRKKHYLQYLTIQFLTVTHTTNNTLTYLQYDYLRYIMYNKVIIVTFKQKLRWRDEYSVSLQELDFQLKKILIDDEVWV